MGRTTFFDTETDGVHLRRKPWEIAFIQERDDLPPTNFVPRILQPPTHREIVIHITDFDPNSETANPEGLAIGRFYERHVDHAELPDRKVVRLDALEVEPPAGKAPRSLVEDLSAVIAGDALVPGVIFAATEKTAAALVWAWTVDADLIGLNPNFDTETLSWMLDRHGWPSQPWNYHLTNIATEAAAWQTGLLQATLAATANQSRTPVETGALRFLLAELRHLPRNTMWLSRMCGVDPPSAAEMHTGLGDARWMQRWWERIVAGVRLA